eukprot:CAMPEP_0177422394 /NCGR_PEP_ID=MMETSP0368-20130122/71306_1 /TAXON_ID=447022 ORGANISM="Scrippsiella hangoei-like, Strain SHHI-4" /NCGR_SAMPLE_ID=MMETSP0368 /ASSEMBLY_ACC=CAM_ASM_000363 /LENGTH=81 /DNA_ID=CAMNT_0018892331 /DNA_START=39 /DNA_END=284 /DNA_ORIENTATION=-
MTLPSCLTKQGRRRNCSILQGHLSSSGLRRQALAERHQIHFQVRQESAASDAMVKSWSSTPASYKLGSLCPSQSMMLRGAG